MADFTVTPASVQQKSTPVTPKEITYGESVNQGDCLYYNSSDTLYYKSDMNAVGKQRVDLMALTPGAANDPGLGLLPGSYVKLGTGVFSGKGVVAYGSNNPGKICPAADVTGTGTGVVIVGVSNSADVLYFKPLNSGEVLP